MKNKCNTIDNSEVLQVFVKHEGNKSKNMVKVKELRGQYVK